MLGMEVVPMPHKSFRFNLATTRSFNADYDGDEIKFGLKKVILYEV